MAIELDNVASGYSTGVINNNFQSIEDELNSNVLRRDGLAPGEANQMNVPLDMNSNPILNAGVDFGNPGSLLTVGEADLRYVNVSGDSMQGSLNMESYPLFVRIAVNGNEAVRKDQLDAETRTRRQEDEALARAIASIPSVREGDFSVLGDVILETSTGADSLRNTLDSRLPTVRTLSGNTVAEFTTIQEGGVRTNESVVIVPSGTEVIVEGTWIC